MNLASMPKAELHLHLEGSARWPSLRDALHHHAGKVMLDSPYWLEPDFRFRDFEEFRELVRESLTPWLSAPTGYSELIRDVVDSLILQKIRYAELNFCPNVFTRVGASPPAVLDLIEAETIRAAEEGTLIRWIAGMNREEGVAETSSWVQKLLSNSVVSGFDLHGTETGWPPDLFKDAFLPVLEAGKKLKIHAGEMVGPESIRSAVGVGATQIGHGLSAIEDPEVIALLKEREIVVEMCPTSNERLQNISSFGDHPIFELEKHGVSVTINSDDSTFFGSNLTEEMFRMVAELGATPEDLVRWTSNALDVALLDDEERDKIHKELREWLVALVA